MVTQHDAPPAGHDAPAPAWVPGRPAGHRWRVADFADYAARRHGLPDDGYRTVWRWSVDDPAAFWSTVADYFDVPWDTPAQAVLAGQGMPGARWFPGAEVNYVRQVLRHRGPGTAVTGYDETGRERVLSWDELARQTGAFAATLRAAGVGRGDRVAGDLPDIPEAVVAFLGCAAIGAVWACCGQDFSGSAVIDRMGQLAPAVLVAAGGYHHAGDFVDRVEEVRQIAAGLPSVRLTVLVPAGDAAPPAGMTGWAEATEGDHDPDPLPVPFDHPLWVLFSSGTTGTPKGIVHGHGGVLLEHLKTVALHLDAGPGDRLFWYTTPSWMMWNLRNSALLCGAGIVCFDGSPAPGVLWQVAARSRASTLGLSPGYLAAARKRGEHPAAEHDLSSLRMLGVTGSVLAPGLHAWAAAELGPGVLVNSISGGTDVVSAFTCSVPTETGLPGEMSARCLGVDLQAWSEEGRPVTDEVGDLVIAAPMPSMPVSFWNDPHGEKYRAAYFATFPGVWRHGDWITLTGRGTVIVHGRSDATLNRNGIRMGSGDIYRVVEALDGIDEALVVGVEEEAGGYWMPLFVVTADGEAGEDLRRRVREAIRAELSPRHVPDEIIAAPGIPHTRTGKKVEIPVKQILRGATDAVHRDALDRPDLLAWYQAVGERRRAGR